MPRTGRDAASTAALAGTRTSSARDCARSKDRNLPVSLVTPTSFVHCICSMNARRPSSSRAAFRDALSHHFGADQVFRDIDRINPGERFPRVIEQEVGSCQALLAVIGSTWLSIKDDAGQRRLDNPGELAARLDTPPPDRPGGWRACRLRDRRRNSKVLVGVHDAHTVRPLHDPHFTPKEPHRPLRPVRAVRGRGCRVA